MKIRNIFRLDDNHLSYHYFCDNDNNYFGNNDYYYYRNYHKYVFTSVLFCSKD